MVRYIHVKLLLYYLGAYCIGLTLLRLSLFSLSLSLSLLFVFSPPKLDWILSPQPRRELPTPCPLRRRRAVLLRPVLRFDWLGEGAASVERMTS